MTPQARQELITFLSTLGTQESELRTFSEFRLYCHLLACYGANFKVRNDKDVSLALYLIRDRDLANAGYLDELVYYGADVHTPDDQGSTPLLESMYAKDGFVRNSFII